MRTLSNLGCSLFVALLVVACSPDSAVSTAGPGPVTQREGGAYRPGSEPNGFTRSYSAGIRGWMRPQAKSRLLYVSNEGQNVIDVYSLPSYTLVGQITDGIDQPEGIATDKEGKLYVSNLAGNTVTVYPQGATSPSLTLSEPNGPDDVAVTKNGHVLAGDINGGVEVYNPGATSPRRRLKNPNLEGGVYGVGVDALNNVYACGENVMVIEFAKLKGRGTNLGLSDLFDPEGVLVDKKGNIVVSDYSLPGVNIYPPGKTSPSATIANEDSPHRSALNKQENQIYVPEGFYSAVNVYTYPSGSLVSSLPFYGSENFISGVALSPAPRP